MYAAVEKSDVIGPEGMEKFCEDIGVEPENVCWHFCIFVPWVQCFMYISTPVSILLPLVHGQVTIIFVVSVGLSVCLSVCAEFFSAVFDPISIKLGHTLCVWV